MKAEDGLGKIYCDASFNPETKKAVAGIYIRNVCSKVWVTPAKDSMHAERLAIGFAMRLAKKYGVSGVVFSDCKGVVEKINNKDFAGSITLKRIRQSMKMNGFKLSWIPRCKNIVADGISRRFVNQSK